ncbi:MAG: hypothetical protein AB3N14_11855 [Flavobacteriaceae bacterium]
MPKLPKVAVLVVDETKGYRSAMAHALSDIGVEPCVCSTLEEARQKIEFIEKKGHNVAGICIDLVFAPGDSFDMVGRKFPSFSHFRNLVRYKSNDLRIIIVSKLDEKDADAGSRTANELNSIGVQSVFINKDNKNFITEFADVAQNFLHLPNERFSHKETSLSNRDLVLLSLIVGSFGLNTIAAAISLLILKDMPVSGQITFLSIVGLVVCAMWLLVFVWLKILPVDVFERLYSSVLSGLKSKPRVTSYEGNAE